MNRDALPFDKERGIFTKVETTPKWSRFKEEISISPIELNRTRLRRDVLKFFYSLSFQTEWTVVYQGDKSWNGSLRRRLYTMGSHPA